MYFLTPKMVLKIHALGLFEVFCWQIIKVTGHLNYSYHLIVLITFKLSFPEKFIMTPQMPR